MASLILAASAAHAPPVPEQVFISPSGEPIRPTAAAPDAFKAWFDRVDVNHDGRIDRAEFRADAVAFFKRLDANHDGVVDGFEVAAYEKAMAPELDVDGDGFAKGGKSEVAVISLLSDPEPVSGADLDLNSRITMAEWLTTTDHRFDLLDTRHRDYLTLPGLHALLLKK
jgi:hypothetical protein